MRTRALPRTMRSRTSPSSTRRMRCVDARALRIPLPRPNAENQPASNARARAGRRVNTSAIASATFNKNARGNTQSSATGE